MSDSEADTQLPAEIRGVLIPLQGELLLLPNAAVAEVIDYREPDRTPDMPDWMLGSINWRQRNLTVVRLEKLLGRDELVSSTRQRIIVCHTLGEEARRPFVGIVATAIPRLVRVREELLSSQALAEEDPADLVQARLTIEDQQALIPDLGALERRLADVA